MLDLGCLNVTGTVKEILKIQILVLSLVKVLVFVLDGICSQDVLSCVGP